MTKQHFKAFADEIKDSDEPYITRLSMALMVSRVANQFNVRFDQDWFMKACGLDQQTAFEHDEADAELPQSARKMWS